MLSPFFRSGVRRFLFLPQLPEKVLQHRRTSQLQHALHHLRFPVIGQLEHLLHGADGTALGVPCPEDHLIQPGMKNGAGTHRAWFQHDKQIDYFNLQKEENPAMGFRAIRICLKRPEIFKTQLRALYRASVYGNIAIMFPMITSVWEIRGGTKDSLLKDKIVLECAS